MRAIGIGRRLVSAPYDLFTYILLFVLVIIVALTYSRYGFTTDETIDNLKAARIVRFIASLGSNRDALKIDDINIYGAMPDVLALLLRKFFPVLSFDSRHLVSALFGVVGIFYTYRLGRVFIAPAVGFFGALFLACNPMWSGYMFINAKDIPFAAMLLASLYYCLSVLTARYVSSWIWVKVGLAIGLLATTKLIGILVLGVFGLAALIGLVAIPSASLFHIDRTVFVRLLKIAISSAVGCFVCFAVFWPQFFFWSPTQLVNVVRLFMNYTNWQGYVQIHGEYFFSDKVPWYYTVTYIVISMPLFLLALTAAGTVYGVLKREPLVVSFAAVCIFFLAYQAIADSRALNGYRHFIFLLPFMMLIAAYPIAHLLNSSGPSIVRIATLTVVLVAIFATLVSSYQLFPYQYSFYNALVGGVPGADGRYYIDLWKSALREALDKIEKLPDAGDSIRIYYSCGSTLNFVAHPRFKPVERIEDADYVVALRRPCDPRVWPGQGLPLVGDVRRQGVVFAAIYSRRKM